MPVHTFCIQNRNLIMTKLLTVFAAALILAYISEQNTRATLAAGHRYTLRGDWAYVLLVIVLTLFAGLRTRYNDTWNYISLYNQLPGLSAFCSNPENFHPLSNPLFYLILNILKDITNNSQVFVFLFSLFTQVCIVRFIKRYSSHFLFSIFIYFTLGTFCLTLAAIKQIAAMAILTVAFPYLEEKKWVQYYLIVLVAMLMHTYAIAFAVLPFFTVRPWKLFTYLFALVMVVVLMNFQNVISAFLDQADELGKTIAEYEVFDDNSTNIFRIAVYAVTPLLSLIFQKWIFWDRDKTRNVLVHMSIISLACMSLGTQSGANMFGRMANYFELGTICCLPMILEQTFERRSYRLISVVACVCFMGFFVYANAINFSFDQEYQAVGLLVFAVSLS